jgi:hypothetical protein
MNTTSDGLNTPYTVSLPPNSFYTHSLGLVGASVSFKGVAYVQFFERDIKDDQPAGVDTRIVELLNVSGKFFVKFYLYFM